MRRKCPPSLALLAWLCLAPLAHADQVTVELSGVSGPLEKNVRAYLHLARAAKGNQALNAVNVRNLHGAADQQIHEALRPFGYYDVGVVGTLSPPRDDGSDRWAARYEITLGPQVRYGTVAVRLEGAGAEDERVVDLRADFPLESGDALSHPTYERAKEALLDHTRELGYRDARYTQARLEVDPDLGQAMVLLTLDTGIAYRFGELQIDQDVIDEALLRRYSTFVAGDAYSTQTLLDFEYRLFDSGFFQSVSLEPLAAVGDQVPILLTATPGTRRAWNLRGGYGTDTGPRIGAGFESRRLNRQGHRLRANLELSTPRQELGGEYLVPLDRPASDVRSYQLGIVNQDLGDTDSRRVETGVRETRRDGPWQRIRYLRYRAERNTTGDDESTAQLTVPGYTVVRSQSNDVTYPTRGTYLEADLHGGVGALLSDTSFLQLRTDLRLIHPVGQRNRLLLRGELGAIWADDFDQLPASERFFAGGDRSVRGFALNNLGPRDEDDQVVGGRYLVVASAEYEQRIVGRWGIGMFVDAGNAFDGDAPDLQAAAGIGLRWLSPIGMVRLDLAHPFTDDADDLRLHFTFGPEL
ncbi:MAG: autotransporter assembly complex family protein [Pseudomonadota bacterium]